MFFFNRKDAMVRNGSQSFFVLNHEDYEDHRDHEGLYGCLHFTFYVLLVRVLTGHESCATITLHDIPSNVIVAQDSWPVNTLTSTT